MKLASLILGVMLVVGVLAPASAQAASYELDKVHTAVYFKVTHFGMSYTFGRFNEYDGKIAFGDKDESFEFTVKSASIDTGHAKRDEHLRSPDFFNVNQFPTITLKSKSFKKVDDVDGKPVYHVTVDLTLHGVTKELTIPFTLMGHGKDPRGTNRIGFNAKFTFQRSDFGMKYGLGAIGDDVTVMLSFEGTR